MYQNILHLVEIYQRFSATFVTRFCTVCFPVVWFGCFVWFFIQKSVNENQKHLIIKQQKTYIAKVLQKKNLIFISIEYLILKITNDSFEKAYFLG